MMNVRITNGMLASIIDIELCRQRFADRVVPTAYASRLQLDVRRESARSTAALSGGAAQHHGSPVDGVDAPAPRDEGPEALRYADALASLDAHLASADPITWQLIMETHKVLTGLETGAPVLRGPRPAGVLDGVRDPETGGVEYIPPKAAETAALLDELFGYLERTDDHPLVKAGILHYQLATIHPFQEANGRIARIICGYGLVLSGFGFAGLASLERLYAHDAPLYRDSLQMGLPPLYYEGRNDPPHPEIWMEYFLGLVARFAHEALEAAQKAPGASDAGGDSQLKSREKAFYDHLVQHGIREYAPIDMAREFDVSNRTIINWSSRLAAHGLVEPQLVRERIRTYRTVIPEA